MFYKKKSYPPPESFHTIATEENSVHCNAIREDSCHLTNDHSKRQIAINYNPFLGFFYTFLTTILLQLASVIVKKLDYIGQSQLSFARSAGMFAGSIPIAIFCATNIVGDKKFRFLLFTNSFLGAVALYLGVTAYLYLPLADATIMLSTVPPTTVVIARVWMKEPCGLAQTFSLALTICGVILSSHLPELINKRSNFRFDYSYFAGLAAAIACVLCTSTSIVALRKMKDIHFSVTMLYSGFIGVVGNAFITSVTSYVPLQCGWDQVLYMLLAIGHFLGSTTFILALQVETAGVVSILNNSMGIIVSMLFQILFFYLTPDVYNIVGGLFIISSVTVLGIRNWLLGLPAEAGIRKRFKYFPI